MIILGDIGNTDSKICIVNDDLRIIKKILIPSKIKTNKLYKYFKKINFNKIEKILFCSVVPSSFKEFKNFF